MIEPPDMSPAAAGRRRTSDDDDAALVRLARGPAGHTPAIETGDADPDAEAASSAFAELVRRHEQGVYLLARSLVRDGTEAEDMVQETFLRAYRNLDLLADPSRFGVWVRRIAFGVCVDWLRGFRPQLFRSGDAADGGGDQIDGLGDSAPSPLDEITRAELARRIMSAIDRLPARYRVPFTMYHVGGLSHAKVAGALGVAEGTARSLVSRARQRLAAALSSRHEGADGTLGADPTASPLDVLDEPPSPAPRLMHVLNGDVVREKLERSDLPGAITVWADALHEGPVSRRSGTRGWREARARFIASAGWVAYPEALRRSEEWDAALERAGEYDEVVLWFEHDLFDQLLLVRHLDWFARTRGRHALTLICVGEYPGIEPFHGLGQLTADQLASLFGTRQAVTDATLHLGRDVWEAFTADDPASLQEITDTLDARTLPFLRDALLRFLAEYPSVANGLPCTEQRILECLRDEPLGAHALFRAEQAREERVFMGDWSFWRRLRGLAAGPAPLIALEGADTSPTDFRAARASITRIGRDVLDGRVDWVSLAGFDRWLGGVHLVAAPGADVPWRWDRGRRRITRTRA